MISVTKYVKVQSLEEAYQLNQAKSTRILGGMLWTKQNQASIGTALDFSALNLNTIEETAEEFRIGCMVTLRDLEKHEGLNTYTNQAVKKAVQDIVGVQFRNLATIGGSLWGRFGFSDVLTVFMVMDCYVELYKGGLIPLSEFASMPMDRDILVRVIVKKVPGKFVYSAMRIQRTDFPVLTCACSILDGTLYTAIGARPGRALLAKDTDKDWAPTYTQEQAKAYADRLAKEIPTGSNNRGSSEYRSHLISVLTYRNLISLGGEN